MKIGDVSRATGVSARSLRYAAFASRPPQRCPSTVPTRSAASAVRVTLERQQRAEPADDPAGRGKADAEQRTHLPLR